MTSRRMRISRRNAIGLGAAGASLGLLAACGTPDSQSGDGDGASDADSGESAGLADDPKFTWALTGADREIHEEVAKLWNSNNPDNQVEISFLAPTADEQRQSMFQDLQSGAGKFDVLGLDVIWTGEFADNGYIDSMEEYRGQIEGNSLEGAIDSASWQEEMFALPYSSNGGFLYYRTDLVDDPPTTWDDLLTTGVDIANQEGIGGYVGFGDQYEGFVVTFLQMFWSAGGELFDSGQTASTFLDGDAAKTALDYLVEAQEQGLFADGFDSMVEDDARALFGSGEAVYMNNWPYAIPLLNDEDESEVEGSFAVAELPSFTGDRGVSSLGGLNNAVSSLSENKELAQEFVLWAATDEEAQKILLDNSLPATLSSTYDGVDDPDIELLGEILESAKARPPVPGYNSLSLAMQENLHQAFLGQMDVDEALEEVNDAAQAALTSD